MSLNTVVGLAEAFTQLTGLDAILTGTSVMVNIGGTWEAVSTPTVYKILTSSGAKITGIQSYITHGTIGNVTGISYRGIFQVGGRGTTFAIPKELSAGMRAALQNAGSQVGSTVTSPVTDLVVQSTGSGNAIQVTSKGVFAKVGLETAIISAAAALGVTIGIGIVETNPELITKIYNRIFNDDVNPDEIADIVANTTVWENIRDGATFLSEDIISCIKDVFLDEGIYTGDASGSITPTGTVIENGGELFCELDYLTGSTRHYSKTITKDLQITAPEGTRFCSVMREPTFIKGSTGKYTGSTGVTIYADKPCSYVAMRGLVSDRTTQVEPTLSQSSGNSYAQSGYEDNEHTIPISTPVYNVTSAVCVSRNYVLNDPVIPGSYNVGIPSNSVVLTCPSKQIPNSSYVTPTEQDIAARYFWLGNQSDIIDINTPSTPQPGVSLKPGAKYPSKGKTLAEDYPDWDDNSIETINGWDDDTSTPSKEKWYPVNRDVDEDSSQLDAQDGNASDDDVRSKIVDDIDNALEENLDNNIDEDIQPQPYPQPNPEPSPNPDIITPNPPDIDASDGEDPDPTIPILTTVATSGLAHIYNPTLAQTRDLGRSLWTPSLIENIKKIFVNPMDGIIGFHLLYATPKTGGEEEIVLGYYGTGVSSKIVTNQYIEIDCGMVSIDEWWNDARDYEPYVNISLYLPFIGIVPLKANDIVNSYVKVKYHVDVLTGTCLAMVEVQKYNSRGTIYQFVGNCAVTIPLSSGNYTAVITSLLSVASSAVGGAVIGGGAGAIIGAVKGVGSNISNSKLQVVQSGNLGSNAGAMGIRRPFFIIRRPITHDAYAYNMQYGYPAFKWSTIGKLKGFTRVKAAHLDNLLCSDNEKKMIEEALKKGVIA